MGGRKPLYRIADRLGVNCADRTDEVIADRCLEEISELIDLVHDTSVCLKEIYRADNVICAEALIDHADDITEFKGE